MLRDLDIGSVDDRLIVGPQSFDDAGVVVLGPGEGLPAGYRLGLVQTVDFFPPVVEDPWFYGAIAAANALSDVYAMGGRAISALNLASFPAELPDAWIGEILRGGYEKVREAGAVLAGGHTVEGEVQFGFAVTGLVDPDRVAANGGARVGDRLVLTKPIGMGVLTTSAKKRAISWDELRPAAEQMAQLNAAAADAMNRVEAHACTDVTGFGLAGHARNVGRSSGVCLRIELARVPIFDGVRPLAERGLFSGGAKRGRAGLAGEVRIAPELPEVLVDLAFDAETSGGLLIAVAPEAADDLERELAARDRRGWAIGEVVAADGASVELV